MPRGLVLRDVSSPGHLLWKGSSKWQVSYQVTGLIIMSHEVSHKKAEPQGNLGMALTLILSPCFFYSILAYTGEPNSDFWGLESGVEVGGRNCVFPIFIVFKKYFHSFIFWGEAWKSEDECVSSLFSPYGFWELISGHLTACILFS